MMERPKSRAAWWFYLIFGVALFVLTPFAAFTMHLRVRPKKHQN